jgi:hypothetical protein
MVKEPSMFNVLYTIGPTKNGAQGIAAIKKAFKVDDKKAKDLLDKAIDFSSSGKIKTLTRSQQSMLNKQGAMKEGKEMKDLDTKNVDKALAHDCAKHVVHEKWGEGKCIPEMHSLEEGEDGTGFVTHYDVMFEHGVEQNVPVWDLEIVVSENHMHSKKKTMKEAKVRTIVDPKKSDAYSKHMKSNKLDDDTVRMIHQNPDYAESKRFMKDPKYAKAVSLYKASMGEEVELDESNPAKLTDSALKSKIAQMQRLLATSHSGSPALQHEIKRLKRELSKRGLSEEVELDEAGAKIDPAKMAAHMARNDKPKKMSSTQKSLAAIRQKAEEFDNGDEVEGGNEEPQLDPVNKKALKKKFKDRKDKDIDNDGDVDDSDKYLHMRRKAVSKALDKKNN